MSDSSESDEHTDFHELSLAELVIWCTLYSTIALFAVLGNMLVIYITVKRFRTRSVTTYLVCSLAFADLLTGILAIPFKFQAALFQEWRLPNELCQLVPFSETVSLSVSVFTLTASAIHEFRTVFFPTSAQISTIRAKQLVFIIWFVAGIISLPHGLFHAVSIIPIDENESIPQCLPVYANEWWKAYNIYLTVIHYFVPMIILDVAYIMIALKIWTNIKPCQEKQNSSTSRRTIRMLIIVVACFSLCWFPLETYLLLNELRPEINGWYYINVFFFCAHWLAMSNSCLNPLIYWLFNEKYTEEYKKVFEEIILRRTSEKSSDRLQCHRQPLVKSKGRTTAVQL